MVRSCSADAIEFGIERPFALGAALVVADDPEASGEIVDIVEGGALADERCRHIRQVEHFDRLVAEDGDDHADA